MRGKLLQLIGASLICAAFLAFLVLQYVRGTHFSIPAWEIYAVGLPVIFGLLVAGGSCYSTGKKISARLAQAHATQYPRAPVVYLRSFKDDPFAAKRPEFVMPTGGAIGGILVSFVGMVTSEEEQLANVMQEMGRLLPYASQVRTFLNWERRECTLATLSGKKKCEN